VQRNEQNLIIVVKFSLGSVSVVDIPVENAHSFAMLFCYFCCNSDIIEDAESSCLTTLSMVARRSNNGITPWIKSFLVMVIQNGHNSTENCMRTKKRCKKAILRVIYIMLKLKNPIAFF